MSSMGVGFRSLYPGLAEFFDRFPEMKGKQGTWWEKGDRTYNPTYADVVGRWEKNWNWPTKGILVIDDKDMTDEMVDFITDGMGSSTARMPYRFSDESKTVRYSWKMTANKDKRAVMVTTEGTLNSTNETVSSKKYAMFWPTQNVNEIKRQSNPKVSDIGAGISTTGYACEVVENSDVKTGPPFSIYVEVHDEGILDHIANLLQCSKNRLVTVMWDVERPEYEELLKSVEMKVDNSFVPKRRNVGVDPIEYNFEIGAAVYKYRYDGENYEYHLLRLPAERVNEIKRGVDPLKTMNVGISAIHPAWDDMVKHFGDRPIPDSRGSIVKTSSLTKLDDIILRERISPVMKSDKLVIVSYAVVPSEVKSKYSGRLRSARVAAFTEIIDDEVYDCEVRQLPIPGIARVNISTLRMVRGREMPTKYEFYVFRAPYAGIVNEIKREASALSAISAGAANVNAYMHNLMKKYKRLPIIKAEEIPGLLRNRMYVVSRILGVDENDIVPISLSQKTKGSSADLVRSIKLKSNGSSDDDQTRLFIEGPRRETRGVITLFDLHGAVSAEVTIYGKRDFWFLLVPYTGHEINEIKLGSSPLRSIDAGKSKMLAYNVLKSHDPKSALLATDTELDNEVMWKIRDEIVAPSLGCSPEQVAIVTWRGQNIAEFTDMVKELDEASGVTERVETEDADADVKSWGDHNRGVWITDVFYVGNSSADDTYSWVRIPTVNEIKRETSTLRAINSGKTHMLAYNVAMRADPNSISRASDDELGSDDNMKLRDDIVSPLLGCTPHEIGILNYDPETWDANGEYENMLEEVRSLPEQTHKFKSQETELTVIATTRCDLDRGICRTTSAYENFPTGEEIMYWVRIPSVNEIKRSGPSLDSIGAGVVMTSSAYDKLVKFEPEILDEISVTSKHSSLHPSVVERRLKCDSSRIAYVYYDILSDETRKIAEEMLSGEINKLEMATLDAHPTLGNTEHEVWVKASAKEGIAKIKIINRNPNKDYVESTMIALRKPIQ